MSNQEHYVIRTGRKNGYYTLWLAFPEKDAYGNDRWGFLYERNLPRDKEKAQARAKELAKNAGRPLREENDLPPLTDFARQTAGEAEAARLAIAAERERYNLNAEREALRDAIADAAMGLLPFGPYAGKRVEDAPAKWLTWFARAAEVPEGNRVAEFTKDLLNVAYPHLLLPEPNPKKTLGNPKERLTLVVTVIRRADILASGYNGEDTVLYVTTMVTDDGTCVVVKSGFWKGGEPGERITIKGTVKEHGEYKGQAQTLLQRVSVLGVAPPVAWPPQEFRDGLLTGVTSRWAEIWRNL